MTKPTLFFKWLALAMLLLSPFSQAETALQLADRYMKAYTAMNYGELEQLYHYDAVFEDPTAGVQGNGQHLNGRKAIIDFLRQSQQGVAQIRFVESSHMVVGNWVVLTGDYHYLVSGPQFGLGPQPVWIVIHGITELKVSTGSGLILKHRDMLDYSSLPAQLQ
ncbi:nuclear transport factor 2 family protein [Gallaecimonas sp. GXIMD1310]|uniref:nuclear transport factor 2 family protein n=1 Tax=Gallaecimonas sp. GXIMD1310 TaxID=3131926 RepID=UPI00324D3A13